MEEFPNHKTDLSPSFNKAISLILLTVFAALVLQNAAGIFDPVVAGILAAGGLAGLSVLAFSKKYIQVIDSPYLAISSLLTIAVGTAAGTFITQTATASVFEQRYGETWSGILQTLQLHDVFHSWWYVGLFVLLAFSLIKTSLRRKFSPGNIGFHLAHWSPIIILAGFWVDYQFGYKGIIQLEEGQSTQVVKLQNQHGRYIQDSTTLDFAIRLDTFEFEKHDPDYRIQIWRKDTSRHAVAVAHGGMNINQKPPTLLTSLAPEEMKIRHIYGTDLYFRVREMYPNFSFKYTYPLLTKSIAPADPGIQIDLKTPDGDGTLQLLANKPNRSRVLNQELFGGWIEFYWELPANVRASLESPGDEPFNRTIFSGADSMIYHVIDGTVSSEKLATNTDFVLPAKKSTTLHVLHIFPDAGLLKAEPSSRGDEWLNPVAKVEIWHKGKSASEAFLYPGKEDRPGGRYAIPGSPFLLAMESLKDRETKFFKSDLSVLSASGDVIRQQSIKVNEPMLHQGHRFYQTDYDPARPNYSGIGVTYNPGLYLIYGGFYLLMAGVGWMFYARTRQPLPLP